MLEKYKDLLTVKDLAEILRVSENQVYDLIEKGQIKTTHRFVANFETRARFFVSQNVTGFVTTPIKTLTKRKKGLLI